MLFFFDLLRNQDYSIYINHKKRNAMKEQIKLFVLLFVLINGVVSLTSCEKEFDIQDENRVELNNSLKSLQQPSLNDETIKMLANKHNEYLAEIIENYRYSQDEDKVINCTNNFLNTELPNLTKEDKLSIVEGFKNEYGEIVPTTSEQFYNALRSTDLPKKEKMIELIKEMNQNIVNSNLVYPELEQFVNDKLGSSEGQFTKTETKILKIYFETLKASAYFWFPQEYGGSGIGYRHLTKIHGKEETSAGQIVAQVCFADCMNLGFSFVVIGLGAGPAGWGVLIASAAYSSALGGIF